MSCNVAQYRPILRSALQYPATSCKVMHAVLHSCSQLLAEFNKCVQYRIGVQDCYVVLCGVVQGHAIQHSIVQLVAESHNVCNSRCGQRGAALRNIAQFCATLDAKIYSKLVQGEAPGHQNRCKFGTGSLLGRPLSANSLPKASQERLGTSPVRPRTAGESPKLPQYTEKEHLGMFGIAARR